MCAVIIMTQGTETFLKAYKNLKISIFIKNLSFFTVRNFD